jgi:ABC-type amino acid transport substrate-binding protein
MVEQSSLMRHMLLVTAFAVACSAATAGEVDIEFGFNNKPPLFHFEDGKAVGDVVEVARQACKLAELRCSFSELPFQRVMLLLEQRRPAFAALGFSKTPEREKFVSFSGVHQPG